MRKISKMHVNVTLCSCYFLNESRLFQNSIGSRSFFALILAFKSKNLKKANWLIKACCSNRSNQFRFETKAEPINLVFILTFLFFSIIQSWFEEPSSRMKQSNKRLNPWTHIKILHLIQVVNVTKKITKKKKLSRITDFTAFFSLFLEAKMDFSD